MKLSPNQVEALMSEAADKMFELQEKNKALREALSETVEWIKNWNPDFVEDDEWPETYAKIEAALRD